MAWWNPFVSRLAAIVCYGEGLELQPQAVDDAQAQLLSPALVNREHVADTETWLHVARRLARPSDAEHAGEGVMSGMDSADAGFTNKLKVTTLRENPHRLQRGAKRGKQRRSSCS